ncbi:MAG: 4Fe-4S dicluster domain-containing protein [Chloroflexota bacterium]
MHSTRGRANLLRAVYTGQLPVTELTGPRLYAAMDLCIECKACKAECPSSVDMAKIKFEYLAQYHDAQGVPLRTKLFANIGSLSRLTAGPLAPLANATLKNRFVRKSMAKTLGIAPQRALPPFARHSFMQQFTQRTPQAPAANARSQVVLFVDPFTNYNYPEIGMAAVTVLETAGFAVIAVAGEDGRSHISKGFVDGARAAARRTLHQLAPFAEKKMPIIGLEPSSLLTLRDEYLYLLRDEAQAQVLAQHAYTFEEFIAKLADEDRLGLTFTAEKRDILLHGHCHQKALVGTQPSQRILRLPPNYTVTEVDSGCCGMAGAFGYEAEHYEISLQMGERRLLPAVRAAAEDTIIVAAGVSCRQQIKHGTQRRALHPAEVLRDALL